MPRTTYARANEAALLGVVLATACGGRRLDATTSSAADAAAADAAPPCTADSIYLVVASPTARGNPYSLEAFHPATASTTTLGQLVCSPNPGVDGVINALAVDRSGTLYVASDQLWVSRIDASGDGFVCEPSIAKEDFIFAYGISFVGGLAEEEQLFVISDLLAAPSSSNPLGILDLDSGAVRYVNDGGTTGVFSGLTGTGDGRLFGMGYPPQSIDQINPTTGSIAQSFRLPPALSQSLVMVSAPLAFWAGDFYAFPWVFPDGGPGYSSIVRFHPADGTAEAVASADGVVVGAAVSTCAPLH